MCKVRVFFLRVMCWGPYRAAVCFGLLWLSLCVWRLGCHAFPSAWCVVMLGTCLHLSKNGLDVLFRSQWCPLGGWVEAYSGCLAEPPGKYGTETKKLGKHLNSSAGYFPTGRPVTMGHHSWLPSDEFGEWRMLAGYPPWPMWPSLSLPRSSVAFGSRLYRLKPRGTG